MLTKLGAFSTERKKKHTGEKKRKMKRQRGQK